MLKFKPVFVRSMCLSLLVGGAIFLGAGSANRPSWGPLAAHPELANAAPPPPFPLGVQDDGMRKSDRLSSHLDQLFRLDLLGKVAGRPLTRQTTLTPVLESIKRSGTIRLDDAGGVQVYVTTAGSPDAVLPDLVRLGFRAERIDAASRTIQGNLPIASLEAAAALRGVELVRQPDYPELSVGSVTTQGDTIVHADQLRTRLGVDGTGVKIGVISDGLAGLAQSQASGDLPPTLDSSTCNVAGQDPTAAAAGAEGTAMLEIVHDLAPGAQLWFGYFGAGVASHGTSLDFMAAVNCLASHVDIVVDDISFHNNGPYDGTSPVSQNVAAALNNPSNPIRGYYTAAGNDALRHYKEMYASSGTQVTATTSGESWMLHRWQGTVNTTDWSQGLSCPGGPSNVYCANTLVVPPGGAAVVNLSWNDPWGTSTNDYDMLLLDGATGTLYLASANRQAGTGANPTESFAFQNAHASTTTFYILVGNHKSAAAPRALNMFVRCSACPPFVNSQILNFSTTSESVPNNADSAGGVLSLGAAGTSALNNGPIEAQPYSSRGPTADGRMKPDAIAPDAVSVSGAGGFPTTFSGTSAAAPHAAGVAALLLSCNPALRASALNDPGQSRTTLREALLTMAVHPWPPTLPDNTLGYGLLNAWTSSGPARCAPTITTALQNNQPIGLTIDHQGKLYVVSGGDCDVVRFVANVATRVAGVGPQPGNYCPFTGEGGPATSATIHPIAVAFDPSDRMYIADVQNCRVYEVSNGLLTTFAGTGAGAPYSCTSSADGPATSVALSPTDLAFDLQGTLFISDSVGCSVRTVLDGVVTTVAGNGSCHYTTDGPALSVGISAGRLAVGSAGEIYISDGKNCRVYELSGGMITTVAGRGWPPSDTYCVRPALDGDGGPATSAYLYSPGGLASDAYGNLYIADGMDCRIRKVAVGIISTFAGTRPPYGSACGKSGDGGPAANAGLDYPGDLALDALGNLYVTEWSSNSVRRIGALDRDNDGFPDNVDNCPFRANPDQANADGDLWGDICEDIDSDGVIDLADNCPLVANTAQINTDAANTGDNRPGADTLGDACDGDADGDGYTNDRETTVPVGENPLLYCDIMRGDVDGDFAVTILDLTVLANHFLETVTPETERYNQDADNAITILDLTMMANLFLDNVAACP